MAWHGFIFLPPLAIFWLICPPYETEKGLSRLAFNKVSFRSSLWLRQFLEWASGKLVIFKIPFPHIPTAKAWHPKELSFLLSQLPAVLSWVWTQPQNLLAAYPQEEDKYFSGESLALSLESAGWSSLLDRLSYQKESKYISVSAKNQTQGYLRSLGRTASIIPSLDSPHKVCFLPYRTHASLRRPPCRRNFSVYLIQRAYDEMRPCYRGEYHRSSSSHPVTKLL